MKHFYPILLGILFSFAVRSQTTTITTYYVIQPTSGCNGVWAIQYSAFAACGPVSTYNINPPGCTTFSGPTSGDTMFLSLCAFPCDITIMTTNGQMCICGTGTTTGLVESAREMVTTYPNPATAAAGWNIWLHSPQEKVEVNVYNAIGELVSKQLLNSSTEIAHVDLSGITPGTYIVNVVVNDELPYRQTLVVLN